MQSKEHETQILYEILNNKLFNSLIIDYLTSYDLKNLVLLNKSYFEAIKRNFLLINRICYESYFQIDKITTYDFCNQKTYTEIQRQNLKLALSDPFLNLSQLTTQFKYIRQELIHNLKYFVSLQQAEQITTQIFTSLNLPSFPLPKLRRQNQGTYCNSQIQMHIVDISLKETAFQDSLQQIFCELQSSIFNQESLILKSINQKKLKQLLLKLRFQAETINSYEECQSPFLNILMLILVCIHTYLVGLKNMFKKLQQIGQNYHLFVQFNLRYNNFKYTILEFVQNFGFLFYHFEVIFNLKLGRYQNNLLNQLWRILLKKWVINMSEFHTTNNKHYNYLFLLRRENNIQKLLQNQQEIESEEIMFNNNKQFYYLKTKNYSDIYKSKYLNVNDSLLQYCNNICEDSSIFNDYTEYLIDTSVNEITVHWCGSTLQNLGNIYLEAQKQILKVNEQFQQHLFKKFRDLKYLDYINKQESEFLQETLKPVTCIKVLKNICQNFQQISYCLIGNPIVYDLSDQQKNILETLQKKDQYIKFINYERNIHPTVEQGYENLYRIDFTIELSQIQNIIEKCEADEFQEQKEAEIEQYISDAEDEMMQIEKEFVQVMMNSSKMFEVNNMKNEQVVYSDHKISIF